MYFDEGKALFKAQGSRTQGLSGLLLPAVVQSILRVKKKGIENTLSGEGRLLGGLVVVDRRQIWLEYREEHFGDHPSSEDVVAAVERCSGQPRKSLNPS